MPREHSSYKGVMVYDGTVGEKPQPGAFYQTKAGDIMIPLAKVAYGDGSLFVKLVNKHPWNVQNVTHYTEGMQGHCTKAQPLGSASGYMVACKEPSTGVRPIVWFPPLTGEGPDEVKPKERGWIRPKIVTPSPGPDNTTPWRIPPVKLNPKSGDDSTSRRDPIGNRLPGRDANDDEERRRQEIIENNKRAEEIRKQNELELIRRAEESKKSTMVWLAGIGLLALGVVVATKTRKGRR